MALHLPLGCLCYLTVSELEALEGSGQYPKRRVADEGRLSSFRCADTLRRFGAAEVDALALWRRRATPASRDATSWTGIVEAGHAETDFFGGSDEEEDGGNGHF